MWERVVHAVHSQSAPPPPPPPINKTSLLWQSMPVGVEAYYKEYPGDFVLILCFWDFQLKTLKKSNAKIFRSGWCFSKNTPKGCFGGTVAPCTYSFTSKWSPRPVVIASESPSIHPQQNHHYINPFSIAHLFPEAIIAVTPHSHHHITSQSSRSSQLFHLALDSHHGQIAIALAS
jgi:hypothetical protein